MRLPSGTANYPFVGRCDFLVDLLRSSGPKAHIMGPGVVPNLMAGGGPLPDARSNFRVLEVSSNDVDGIAKAPLLRNPKEPIDNAVEARIAKAAIEVQ